MTVSYEERTAPRRAPARLRVAYVYRNFDHSGSIPDLYRRNAERLALDEDVTAVCSAATREPTNAPPGGCDGSATAST